MVNRVAIISEHASPLCVYGGVDSGGQNVYVEQIALNLAYLNIQVDVYTRRDSESAPDIIMWQGIRIINITAGPPFPIPKEEMLPYMEEFSRNTLKFIQEQNFQHTYDIVHANFWMSGLVATYLQQALGIPFVITFHALGRVRRSFLGEKDTWGDERLELEQKIIEAADAIIAECPQDRDDLLNLYTVSPKKIRMVPCGYDNFDFWRIKKDKAREHLHFPQDEFILLNIGRLVPRKGIDNIINAVAHLSSHHGVKAKLAIVGGETETPNPEETPEIGRLMQIASSKGVQDQVLFAGHRSRSELKYFYAAADVFITTPWYEPFGITPLEAMACGTPVIGSRVGGIQYSVKDKETGLLVEPNDPEELAKAILTLHNNPDLLNFYAEQAHTRIAQFHWDKITAALLLVYEEVLSRPRPYGNKKFMPIHNAINSLEAACDKIGELIPSLLAVVTKIQHCFAKGGKLLLAGNGGSAAQAQHLAAELVGQFQKSRQGLPAIALTADTTLITAWANDVSFDDIFVRQIEAFGKPKDIFLCLSTSGMSKNLTSAIKKCKELNIPTIAISGKSGGEIANLADTVIIAPGDNTQRVQEMQLFILHLLVELIEQHEQHEQPKAINKANNLVTA